MLLRNLSQQTMDLPKFRVPFSALLVGCSQSGKTCWITKFILNVNTLIDTPPHLVLYFYNLWQPSYDVLQKHGVKMCQGVPDVEKIRSLDKDTPKLCIFDDLMSEMSKTPDLISLFTRDVHHLSINCVHIVQNMFFEGLRTSRINSKYLILMKNPSDKLQVLNLARQLYPGTSKFFLDAYADATKQPYSYLVVDLAMPTAEEMRLRTNIFPSEWPTVVYAPKSI